MSEVIIKVRDDGPYLVTGAVKLTDAEGNELAIPPGKANIALCRCGHSQNKPFCDGAHKGAGFQNQVRATPTPNNS
jgi:CDGSH iron-sulfur domain-containing protein 3